MSTIPASRPEQIDFFEQHAAVWANDPAAIGLASAVVSELNGLTQQARASFVSVQALRQAALAGTTSYHTATDAMRAAGAAAIDSIRAYAKTTGDDEVYALAQIPPPQQRDPAPPPAAPAEITLSVQPNGSIVVKWKITQPVKGAEIQTVIQRRLNNTGPWENLGVTGLKTFTDSTVPAGAELVTYMLHATRGGEAGPFSQQTSINLGIPGNQGEQGLSLAA